MSDERLRATVFLKGPVQFDVLVEDVASLMCAPRGRHEVLSCKRIPGMPGEYGDFVTFRLRDVIAVQWGDQ